jgi:hypothetical protein
MLVAVTGLGSIWSFRPGRDTASTDRFTREAAFFNTTGVSVDGTLRRRSRVYGEVRFNGSIGLDPHDPTTSMLHRVFRCPALSVWNGANRLLCEQPVKAPASSFLVVFTADDVGRVASGDHWKSDDSQVISWSESDEAQELLLLMQPFSWIRTARGLFVFQANANARGGSLVLE